MLSTMYYDVIIQTDFPAPPTMTDLRRPCPKEFLFQEPDEKCVNKWRDNCNRNKVTLQAI